MGDRRLKSFSKLKSECGMALILVLGAIIVISVAVIEFAYNTNVNYHLARNEADRLKAMYLAKSAYNFMLVEMKFDKVFRQVVQSNNLGQFLGGNANLPLCQQFPLSTGLIRAVFLDEEGAADLPEELKGMISAADKSSASEFLAFDGDFDGECFDESTKINLNVFARLNPLQRAEEEANTYDEAKLDLIRFIGRDAYKEVFEELKVNIPEVVRNIADWVDSNESINEMRGVESGPESMVYERKDLKYPIKNREFFSLDEVFLVDGVVDDWFTPLRKYFTIYGSGKVNVCSADEMVVRNVIRRYVEGNPSFPSISLNEEETMSKLVQAVSDGCAMGGMGNQLTEQIASSLDAAIGAIGAVSETTRSSSSGFASLISNESRFFSFLLTGAVGDVSVTIKAAVDAASGDPRGWKLLYWRIY